MIKKNFRINPKYTLILKNDNSLLCTKKDGKTFKYFIENSEIEIETINTILNQETFFGNKSKIFQTLLLKKIVIANNYVNEYNTKLYLDTFLNKNCNTNPIKNTKILLIGLGGIGSEIINHLLGIGIKEYILVDYDKVEKSNFNRQYLFTMNDLYKNKTDVLEKVIRKRITNAKITKYNMKITISDELINIISKEKTIDIIICAADTPFLDIRMSILTASIKTNIPCIFGGVGVFSGEFGPLIINNSKKKKYYNYLKKYKKIVKNYNLNKASFGPTNAIVSAYMAKDIILLLLNEKSKVVSLNKIVEIDFEKGKINEKTQF